MEYKKNEVREKNGIQEYQKYEKNEVQEDRSTRRMEYKKNEVRGRMKYKKNGIQEEMNEHLTTQEATAYLGQSSFQSPVVWDIL
ncbi:hypothetical protein AVEN_76276-1 [Araneus ventricosus]|uniref:Uncharacterized protein n=1 Tax=Araneus ventricosus TaxID=182803 RepID=A0A4Y2T8E5_ARAVE|nr:hypothetical protein AVEN_76276-1 [Araneus ventricosus]